LNDDRNGLDSEETEMIAYNFKISIFIHRI
jgi:hypothetical protein